jgi:hypothetical protein
MLVRANNRAIKKHLFEIGVFGESGEEGLPYAFVGPAREATERGIPRPECDGKITPRGSCSCHPEHGFNKQAIVGTSTATVSRLALEKPFNSRPLVVSQQQSWHSVFFPKDRM